MAEQLGDSSVRLSVIEQPVEWQHALVKHRLDFEWSLECPPLDAFLQHLLPASKASFIYRQGTVQTKMGAFRQWTTVPCILTNTGYLHLGETTLPSVSIQLAEEGIIIAGQNERDLAITQPAQPGIFGRGERKHTLRFTMDTEMVEWLLAIRSIRDEVIKDKKEIERQDRQLSPVEGQLSPEVERPLERPFIESSAASHHLETTTPIVMDEDNPWA